MNQPPHSPRPPDWLRPPGVAAGTWQYVHQRTIARHYDDFVADTPLCELDRRYVLETLAAVSPAPAATLGAESDDFPPLILDLGAGTGRLADPVRQLGYDVLAVDLSQSMLETLLERHGDRAATQTPAAGTILPMRANLVQLDALADAIADHAICMFSTIGMIQGRANRVRFLCHIARAVRPGGCLILHVHRRWAALRETGGMRRLLRSWIDSFRGEAEFGDATYAYRGLDKMFMHRFSEREIQSELKAAGWTVQRIDRVGLDGGELTQSAWNASGLFLVCTRE
ncbi:Methyltransferase domain protein [Stieleria neptunia]|uniref:Methyltransferase domain protein n=1 Tax=Stieleria neptunia TaxID=2527979 RepID=A0A518HLC3_9BACT|nr:class I SAM-dependent methyltransferase [Stieleria neptunia]QDV41646.1 Methyltransferase domain protein [Stieleria neptunia]